MRDETTARGARGASPSSAELRVTSKMLPLGASLQNGQFLKVISSRKFDVMLDLVNRLN